MKPYRKTAVVVGLLCRTDTITFYVGHMLILGVLDVRMLWLVQPPR